MACQASARMARVWNSCADWLHKGRMLIVGRKRFLLSFWKCMLFILSAIVAVGHLGAIVGPWGSMNTLSSVPSTKGGGEIYNRGCLRGGPVVARLGPLLFLPGCWGGFLRHRVQGDLGPGSLVLRERVALRLAFVPSISPTYRRLGLWGGWCLFSCLLSRRRSGASSECRCGSTRLGWMASRDVRPQTHPEEAGARILFLQCRQRMWEHLKQKDGCKMSRGRTTISWACRVLQGRRGVSVATEPDGAPEEATCPACEMVPQVETIRARARGQPLS